MGKVLSVGMIMSLATIFRGDGGGEGAQSGKRVDDTQSGY